MRSIWVATAVVVAMTACQTGGDLGGGDPGWELDDDPFAGLADPSVSDSGDPDHSDEWTSSAPQDVSATCLEDGATDNVLSATVSGNAATIEHSGLVTACDVGWDVTAAVDASSGAIYVSYSDPSGTVPEQDGCWCAWTVSYTLTGLATGDYTVYALTESAPITVE